MRSTSRVSAGLLLAASLALQVACVTAPPAARRSDAVSGYLQRYANARRDSYVDVVLKPGHRPRVLLDGADAAAGSLILTDGRWTILDGLTGVVGFDATGVRWTHPKWHGSPAVLADGLLYVQSARRKDDLEAIEPGSGALVGTRPISGLVDTSWLTLLQPGRDGLVAQVSYQAVEGDGECLTYERRDGALRFTWSSRAPGRCEAAPLVNREQRFVMAFSQRQAQRFALGEASAPAPQHAFALPEGTRSVAASSAPDGDLFLALVSEAGVTLEQRRMTGESKRSTVIPTAGREPLHPPILTPGGRVFLLADEGVVCVEGGEVRWSRPLPGARHATAFAGGALAVAAGRRLVVYDAAGAEALSVELDEALVAPPVAATDGRLLLLTGRRVYLLE